MPVVELLLKFYKIAIPQYENTLLQVQGLCSVQSVTWVKAQKYNLPLRCSGISVMRIGNTPVKGENV